MFKRVILPHNIIPMFIREFLFSQSGGLLGRLGVGASLHHAARHVGIVAQPAAHITDNLGLGILERADRTVPGRSSTPKWRPCHPVPVRRQVHHESGGTMGRLLVVVVVMVMVVVVVAGLGRFAHVLSATLLWNQHNQQ